MRCPLSRTLYMSSINIYTHYRNRYWGSLKWYYVYNDWQHCYNSIMASRSTRSIQFHRERQREPHYLWISVLFPRQWGPGRLPCANGAEPVLMPFALLPHHPVWISGLPAVRVRKIVLIACAEVQLPQLAYACHCFCFCFFWGKERKIWF